MSDKVRVVRVPPDTLPAESMFNILGDHELIAFGEGLDGTEYYLTTDVEFDDDPDLRLPDFAEMVASLVNAELDRRHLAKLQAELSDKVDEVATELCRRHGLSPHGHELSEGKAKP